MRRDAFSTALRIAGIVDRFILKGAQLFRIWGAEQHRPTRDLDLLGYGDSSEGAIRNVFGELLQTAVEPADGLEWSEVRTGPIRDDLDYGGVRAHLPVQLAGAQLTLQIDIGFGDAITPEPEESEWNELLGFPAARLLVYPPETVVAEKLEAAVTLGLSNSRMKDFFDLHWLSRNQTFEGGIPGQAIHATFARRETALPKTPPLALTETFSKDQSKQIQWDAFQRKGKLKAPKLPNVIKRLYDFLMPLLSGEANNRSWKPERGWN